MHKLCAAEASPAIQPMGDTDRCQVEPIREVPKDQHGAFKGTA